jgi:predicted ATP-grasp superfamily ATP-dependent carboligase
VAFAGSRKTLQWPPTLGVGIVFESWYDKRPVELGLKFARAALQRGIFELELIYDKRIDDYVAIDLNPRAHGHITFDIARGNNLPFWWYQMATGETLAIQPAASDKVRWLHSIPYHVGGLIGLARGPERRGRFSSYVGGLRGNVVDIINDPSDPLPSVAHTAYMFRHPGGLLKPFLSES